MQNKKVMVYMKRIFLVEDEKNLRDLLKSYLVHAGYEVKTFDNGLAAKKAVTDNPDMWILDIMLPGMDGYDIMREIKNNNLETPVIFMSAKGTEKERVTGLEMGSEDYLSKPFLPRELILKVDRFFENNKKTKSQIEFPLTVLITGVLKDLRI